MTKGTATSQYSVGEEVEFLTRDRVDMSPEGAKSGPSYWEKGTVCKLHASGRQGSAEIHTAHKGKICRKLQNVRKLHGLVKA